MSTRSTLSVPCFCRLRPDRRGFSTGWPTIHDGIASLGHGVVAWAHLSARPLGDSRQQHRRRFASRAPGGFDLKTLHLFAMAQIAVRARQLLDTLRSAQSVVAHVHSARHRRGALQWIRQMTPVIPEMSALITVIAIEAGSLELQHAVRLPRRRRTCRTRGSPLPMPRLNHDTRWAEPACVTTPAQPAPGIAAAAIVANGRRRVQPPWTSPDPARRARQNCPGLAAPCPHTLAYNRLAVRRAPTVRWRP